MRAPSGFQALIALALLAGCSRGEADHDKPYYRAHVTERAAELAACQADPGRRAATANCVNALAADADAEHERFWTVTKPAARVAAPGRL